MSSIYQTEPPTDGKLVIVCSSIGELEIELWPKQAPLAVRNFVQLAMEGFYDGLPFHRVVKGFIAQSGDPSGTGKDVGDSIYDGKPFKDEFHSRLKFNHRGQLAMANSGSKHTNLSQFFITLSATPELSKKHTIFGKVVGDSLYNLTKFDELEVDSDNDDRPIYPPIIKSIEVISNPFSDIKPRYKGIKRSTHPENQDKSKETPKKRHTASKAVKNRKLLSFDEDEDEG